MKIYKYVKRECKGIKEKSEKEPEAFRLPVLYIYMLEITGAEYAAILTRLDPVSPHISITPALVAPTSLPLHPLPSNQRV